MNKSTVIGGAVAATTVAVGVGVGATQSSHKPITNKEKLVNFKFNEETDGCKEWLEQEFKEVNEEYRQKVVGCVESKKLADIAGYFKLTPIDLENDSNDIGPKWSSGKRAKIVEILGSPSGVDANEVSHAQVKQPLISHCTTKNETLIDIAFSEDDWSNYLIACIKEGEKFREAMGKKFWINENKETSN